VLDNACECHSPSDATNNSISGCTLTYDCNSGWEADFNTCNCWEPNSNDNTCELQTSCPQGHVLTHNCECHNPNANDMCDLEEDNCPNGYIINYEICECIDGDTSVNNGNGFLDLIASLSTETLIISGAACVIFFSAVVMLVSGDNSSTSSKPNSKQEKPRDENIEDDDEEIDLDEDEEKDPDDEYSDVFDNEDMNIVLDSDEEILADLNRIAALEF